MSDNKFPQMLFARLPSEYNCMLEADTVVDLSSGVFGGGGGMAKNFFVDIGKKLENLVWPLLSVNTSGQRKFASPFLKS